MYEHGTNDSGRTPSQEIADLLCRDFGGADGLDHEALMLIAAKPFAEAFETAFYYLLQQGDTDPASTLAPWLDYETDA